MQRPAPFCYKYLPVILSGFSRISCGVPVATTRPPPLAAARPYVDDIVRVADDIEVVFNDNDRRAVVQQGLNTRSNTRTSSGCRPMLGSSKTNTESVCVCRSRLPA